MNIYQYIADGQAILEELRGNCSAERRNISVHIDIFGGLHHGAAAIPAFIEGFA
jgi:hypothetical protein